MSARLPVLFALMLIAVASRGMSAQQALSSHTLVGTVTDPGSQPLGGATVELSQAASTNSVRTVVTAADGRYRLERILPGLYVLTVRLAGFGAAIRDLEIGGGSDEFALDVQLRPLLADNKNAAPPASLGPDRRVVCGLTMITPQNPDRKMTVPEFATGGNHTLQRSARADAPAAAGRTVRQGYDARCAADDLLGPQRRSTLGACVPSASGAVRSERDPSG